MLRKKPPGALLPSAHAIDREYRVMQALASSGVPVPRMLAWCGDERVIGTAFYLMEFLDGRAFPDPALPEVPKEDRAAIYNAMNQVIAALHRVDIEAVGLAGFGRPGNYVQRQVDRWIAQCERATLPLPSAMRELIRWLPAHAPGEARSALVHGDFRIDNLVFHLDEPRVIGVLDWELSTVGDPLADFSYHCMAWRIPPQVWRGMGGLPLDALGIPRESDYVHAWEERTGIAATHWDFYLAYNLFRIAAILHGIAQRAADGSAAAANAAEQGARAGPLAELALAIARH
ncbi:aminoglycoside phosphotransferase [Bradyrhizobium yuanmingense]|uniref:Aminoglycoside phosphotransferase n=1 Tax=Bradyrhizobium yuanmingense TaxID=108015 RepID=A0A0R3CLZ7_9BRAD|nr:aminoglycoside phosphotransferase [Bradyrhizobium yuanmingense]